MESHVRSVRDMDAKQKADKAAGIFYFNHPDSKRTRRASQYKDLFGEHLLNMCEKADLFAFFLLISRPG